MDAPQCTSFFSSYHIFQGEHGDVVLERLRVEGFVHVDEADGDDDAAADDVVVRSP